MPTDVLTPEALRVLKGVAEALPGSQPAVAFTGAGISTESGIPDYRGQDGLWKRIKPTGFKDFVSKPEVRLAYWARRPERYREMSLKQPNSGHLALVRLQRTGLLDQIITQNIDGLHQKAGSDPESVIELHGSIHRIRCLDCGSVFDAAEFDEVEPGTEPPCPVCGGMLKEGTISFGQSLDPAVLRRGLEASRRSRLMLVVGSTLIVNPAAKMPRIAEQSGASIAIVNNEPTPLDPLASFVAIAPAGPALEYLANLVGA